MAQWESGGTEPAAANLRKAAALLGVSAEYLSTGQGPQSSGTIGQGPIITLSEGELVDLATLDPKTARELAAIVDDNPYEIWKLSTDLLAAAGVMPGDYLLVDTVVAAKPKELVLATVGKHAVFRMNLPPYLYALPISNPPPQLVVDNIRTIVKGVIRKSIRSHS